MLVVFFFYFVSFFLFRDNSSFLLLNTLGVQEWNWYLQIRI